MTTIRRDAKFKKNQYELDAWQRGQTVCGVDEVGRGCLAGPVVATALILHPGKTSRLVKDSKLITYEERLTAYRWILKNSWHGTGIVHHRTIDRVNIYQATMIAMRRAVMQLFAQLERRPHSILVDAVPLVIPTFEHDIITFPFGESKSSSIAAASIVAKVTRDALMQTIDASFPRYGLAQHKGYSTPQHKAQIRELKPNLLHRTSFIDHLDNAELVEQLSLFEAASL